MEILHGPLADIPDDYGQISTNLMTPELRDLLSSYNCYDNIERTHRMYLRAIRFLIMIMKNGGGSLRAREAMFTNCCFELRALNNAFSGVYNATL